jgi:endonuclease G
VREIARAADAVYIFTGPIFSGKPEFIGRHRVAVPSHTFKVALVIQGGARKMYAAIVPNAPLVSEPLEAFTTSVEEVQRQTGLDFFAALDDAEERLLESCVNSFGR